MANVMINELNLVAIGDALRSKLGETKTFNGTMVTECVPKVSKTPNATGFTTHDGGYGTELNLIDVVTIPNATRLKVTMSYQTTAQTEGDYICVKSGSHSSISDFNTATQYKSKGSLKMVTLYFDNTDTVSFFFCSDSFTPDPFLGYYAEVVAVDSNGDVAVIEQTFDNLEIPNTFKPREMADAIISIPSGGGGGAVVDLNSGKNFSYLNYGGAWDDYIANANLDTISGARFQSAFYQSKLERVPDLVLYNNSGVTYFTEGEFQDCFLYAELKKTPKIHGSSIEQMGMMFQNCQQLEEVDLGSDWTTSYSANWHANNMFENCYNLKTVKGAIPLNNGGNITQAYRFHSMFNNCYNLKSIDDDFFSNCIVNSSASRSGGNMFYNCYSLRKVPTSYMTNMINNYTGSLSSYHVLYRTFYNCYTLDEIIDLALPKTSSVSSDALGYTFTNCARIKELTFAQENGAVPVRSWSNQVIDLSKQIGYVDTSSTNYITNYNSGLTEDTRVRYQSTHTTNPHWQYDELKDNPDYWTSEVGYSRYNHQSAVNTINSLPDFSSGSGNTIKFNRLNGNYTDEGGIDNLTDAEIAVAAAKGWTVSLV